MLKRNEQRSRIVAVFSPLFYCSIQCNKSDCYPPRDKSQQYSILNNRARKHKFANLNSIKKKVKSSDDPSELLLQDGTAQKGRIQYVKEEVESPSQSAKQGPKVCEL